MKTIGELQQELRIVRNDLAKMDEHLSQIETELMRFNNPLQDDINFKNIYDLAQAMPIIPHPVVKMQQTSKSIYFGMMLMVATLERSICEQQMLFLQRMIMADEARKSIDYYLGSLMKIQQDNIILSLNNSEIISYSDQLILDLLLIAKLGQNCTEESFGVISDIAAIFKRDKADFFEISNVAVAVLKQDWRCLANNSISITSIDSKYGYYLNELTGWKEYVNEIKVKKAIKGAVKILNRVIGERK